jgi:small GTP-binding protein
LGGITVVKAGAAGSSGGGDKGKKAGKDGDKEFDIAIKLLLLGDSGVGKTSLMMRYAEDKFSNSLLSTAGVDYQTQYLDIDGRRVKCQIWDTAGQQRFHVITQAYYKGAHGIVLVYDAADPSETSFNNVRYWMENIRKHANAMVQKVLIGNKIDMKGKKVESARGKATADEFSMRFAETSAKDGTGVRDAFTALARDIVTKMVAAGMTGTEPAAAAAAKASAAAGNGAKDGKKDKDCVIM